MLVILSLSSFDMADDADGANHDDADNVFIYTTGLEVPHDVVHCRVHPSVTVVPADFMRVARDWKLCILWFRRIETNCNCTPY